MSIVPFSSRFKASMIHVGSAEQYVRTGGSGPAVLLLHGFGDTGDMWQPLAEVLVADQMVIVPDLRGMGSRAIRRTDTRRPAKRVTSARFSIA